MAKEKDEAAVEPEAAVVDEPVVHEVELTVDESAEEAEPTHRTHEEQRLDEADARAAETAEAKAAEYPDGVPGEEEVADGE